MYDLKVPEYWVFTHNFNDDLFYLRLKNITFTLKPKLWILLLHLNYAIKKQFTVLKVRRKQSLIYLVNFAS